MIFIEDSKIYQFQNECMLFILVLWSGFCKYVEFCEIGGYLNNLIIGWGGGWVNVLHFFYLWKKQKRSYSIARILPIFESFKFITSLNQSSFVNSIPRLPQHKLFKNLLLLQFFIKEEIVFKINLGSSRINPGDIFLIFSQYLLISYFN